MTDPLISNGEAAHRSPPLGILAIVFTTLFLASMATNAIMTGGVSYPVPYNPVQQIQDYYTRFPDVMRVVSFLQFGASIPLGLFTATIVSRLLFHRVNAAGVHIALFGGIAASVFLGVSSLATWMLSQPGVAIEKGAMRAVELLAFATGGFGNVAALGLLLAGVSVPSLFLRLMPRWACWFGLIIAAIAELSTLSMVFPAASLLLPLARFPSFVWLIVAGFTIPKRRSRNS
jgi:hypothetical protein